MSLPPLRGCGLPRQRGKLQDRFWFVSRRALLGGTGRLWGPIVGVIPFALLQEYINANYSNYSTLVMGIAFLVIVYFLPKGVVGRIEQLLARRGHSTW